jgi:hypothetical protein
MSVFLHSIRRNGYQGDIVIIGNGLRGDFSTLFIANDVEYYEAEPEGCFSIGRWKRYLPHIPRYDYVFCCDTTDVVIQSDLDGLWVDGVHVTEESANVGDEGTNTHYVRIAHGDAIFERIKNTKIINGGTVWGNRDSMLEYCREIISPQYRGTDQGILIGLAREGIINATIHTNRESVWTLALEGYTGYGIPLKPLEHQFIDGKLATLEGHIPDVVHQYNRFPSLVQKFTELYA